MLLGRVHRHPSLPWSSGPPKADSTAPVVETRREVAVERPRKPPPSLTSNKHSADGEDLLGVCVSRHIAEAHTGETAEREVQGGDVGAA